MNVDQFPALDQESAVTTGMTEGHTRVLLNEEGVISKVTSSAAILPCMNAIKMLQLFTVHVLQWPRHVY